MDKRDGARVAAGLATKTVGTAASIKIGAIALVLALVGLVVFSMIMAASVASSASDNCSPPGGGGGGGGKGNDDPSERTFNDEQIENAQAVDNAAKNGDLGGYAVKLGLMTAIIESDLINVEHGDAAGPDSRGIFQQRDKAWGSESERMDPFKAAQAFFGVADHATAPGLVDIDGWEDMEPTEAIHAVQKNADPGIYADAAGDALAVADQAGIDLDRTAAGAQNTDAAAMVLAADETPAAAQQAAASTDLVWPAGKDAKKTSPYGWREHPVSGGKKFHSGQDFGVPSGTDVHAMADGEVMFSGSQSGYGNVVIIKHTVDGEVIGSAYAHLSKRIATVGQQVAAGDLIAKSGGDAGDPGAGTSTGAHLHFEVRPGNHGTGEANTTDPIQFLKTGKAGDAPGGGGGNGGGDNDDKCGTGGNDGNTPGGTPDGAPEPPKKEGGRWPEEDCSEDDPTQPDKADACVTPRTAILVELAKSENFGHDGATCWDAHEQNPSSDHPKGRACDFTYGKLGKFPDDSDVKRGDALANYLKENYDTWGVSYVIWQGKIWSKSKKDQGWRDYSGGGTYDPNDPTGGHYDHVHASMQ